MFGLVNEFCRGTLKVTQIIDRECFSTSGYFLVPVSIGNFQYYIGSGFNCKLLF
jgi:hypothetical protein